MKYKILIPDVNGQFTFTKEELEKFMEEIYNEGYNEGMKQTITTPSYPPNPIMYPSVTWSDSSVIWPEDKTASYDVWMRSFTTAQTGDENGK